MNFTEAYNLMKKGFKVKRASWAGYWEIQNGTIMMYTKDGEIIDLFDTKDKMYTLDNIAATDFVIADEHNTIILGGELVFDFTVALKYLLKGKRMKRIGWNGKNQCITYQKGYPDGIPCNKNTAESWGINEGDLFKCEPYLQIRNAQGTYNMWVPSISDLFAKDWTFAD